MLAQLGPQQPRTARLERLALLDPVLGKRGVVDQAVLPELGERGVDRVRLDARAAQTLADLVLAARTLG